MWRDYLIPDSLEQALDLLAQHGAGARLISGGTDLVIELDTKARPACILIDISQLPGLNHIQLDDAGDLHLGPLVTHNDVIASALCVERAFPLAQACRQVGAPQIRNRATIAGNLITASPANDTITPLMALDASLTLRSAKGERKVSLRDFYIGVRKTVLQPDEMLVDISFKAMQPNQRGAYLKFALRRAQAISVVNCCAILDFRFPISDLSPVANVVITLGAVAPKIIHAVEAEQFLVGRVLNESAVEEAAQLAAQAGMPIDDVRATANYRRQMTAVLAKRILTQLMHGTERDDWHAAPALLVIPSPPHPSTSSGQAPFTSSQQTIITTVNGREYAIENEEAREKTLLRFLREDCGLIGTKEGCSEGECGACTVLLDGKAVMACLVPAPRAHGTTITTVEGVALTPAPTGTFHLSRRGEGELHPLQQAFIDAGAVQCGYCTPGFIMSGAALLQEHPQPSEQQIKESISGNLCRCTGYYKILEAFRIAGEKSGGLHLGSQEVADMNQVESTLSSQEVAQ
jgi:carbon-monoxide dehydrogenase medium subunit